MRWFAAAFGAWMAPSWTPVRISEDAAACYLQLERCPSCLGITGAPRPLCAANDALYQRLLRAWLGRHVRVEEVACVATGAPHWTYALSTHLL